MKPIIKYIYLKKNNWEVGSFLQLQGGIAGSCWGEIESSCWRRKSSGEEVKGRWKKGKGIEEKGKGREGKGEKEKGIGK